MKKHTFTTILISSLAFSMFVSGCNMSSHQSDKKNSVSKEKVTLSLWGAQEDAELLRTMISSFKKNYESKADIEVTISPESELTCKNTVLANPKAAGDVFTFAEDQFDELVQAGALLPITEDTDQIIESCGGRDSAAIEAVTSDDGKLYAYPATSSNGYFMFYNSKYFHKQDVTSLDQMLKIAAKNQKKVTMDFTSGWYIYSFFKGAGLDVYKDHASNVNVCNWNATDTKYTGVDVLNSMLAIAKNPGFSGATDEEFVEGIKDGSIIAGISGTWNAKVVQDKFGDDFAACKLPTFTLKGDQVQMHSVVGFKEVGVNAYSKQPVWAQRLAAWITNEENQKLRFKERGEAPANKAAAATKEVQDSPAIAALSKQSKFGHIQKVTESYWTPVSRMGIIILAGNSKNKDLQQLLDKTVEQIQKPAK